MALGVSARKRRNGAAMMRPSRLDQVPADRIRRGVSFRIARAAAAVTGWLDPERKLRCNACGERVAQYIPYAGKPNRCPACGCAAKERLVLALIDAGLLALPEDGRCLHLAPSELGLIKRMSSSGSYIAADIDPQVYPGLDVHELDLTELANRHDDFGVFDLIYASHVLEHIPDDHAALDAVARSLVPGGSFWMLVPLSDSPTLDGNGTESIRDRERLFGQWDHVRQYGVDVEERLHAAGFGVSTLGIDDLQSSLVFEAGLSGDDIVWVCRTRSNQFNNEIKPLANGEQR